MGSVGDMDKSRFVEVAALDKLPRYDPADQVLPMSTQVVTEISSKILDIIFDYALNKFDDTEKRHAAGRPKFLAVIDRFVAADARVDMCLPAFPFKSANKVYKVFGILPDKAEELALQRLDSMCRRIGEVYPPGAQLTIISDGLVYNGELLLDHIYLPIFFLLRYLGSKNEKRSRTDGCNETKNRPAEHPRP